jgi:hypothetical protein
MTRRSEEAEFLWLGFFSSTTMAISALVFCALFITGMLALRPLWMDMEREAVTHSRQYTESKTTMLMGWITEYNKLETDILTAREIGHEALEESLVGQQEVILGRIWAEAIRVPRESLPKHVQDFLDEHPQ